MQSVMEHQLNNKNGGFGDIFLLLFSHAKFFLQNQQNTHTHKQTEKRERDLALNTHQQHLISEDDDDDDEGCSLCSSRCSCCSSPPRDDDDE